MEPEQPEVEQSSAPDEPAEPSREPAEETEPDTPLFPIVGVGASAGGLEAFTQLLSHLPTDIRMGFVLVQHLAPHHPSMLTELLSRATKLPVTEVKEGMMVEGGHVYVIPPNTNIAILNSTLRLMSRAPSSAPRLPIDYFLTSLASDRRGRAIGVILSGSASDGTLGMKAIKAEGGITFAQDDGSAKFDSMPRSAIAAGYVDFVLPPDEIARELARIARHPYFTPGTPVEAEGEPKPGPDDLHNVFILLRSATGVDFSHYKMTTINRRINRRMVLHNMDVLSDYINYLRDNRAELQALYKDILINVTSFFREPESFEALKTEIFPRLVSDRPSDSPLRIWVPGCSTGEEAYSVAMCAVEFLSDVKSKVGTQIFATDISEPALEKARAGRYGEGEVRDVSAERLRRFFSKTEGDYLVNKSIRELCIFARQNVIKDPPFSRIDLISCRNLLIYLDASVQRKLLPIFHYAMRSHGLLILEKSEGTGDFSEYFSLVDKQNRIYSKKTRPGRGPLAIEPSEYPRERMPPGIRRRQGAGEIDLQTEVTRTLLAECTPPGLVVNSELEVIHFHGHTGPYLDPMPGSASLRLLKIAREGLPLELRAAIRQVQEEGKPITKGNIRITSDGETREIAIEVRPLRIKALGEPYFLVLFRETAQAPPASAPPEAPVNGREILEVQGQLDHTRTQLQDIIEQFETANEELRAANEEIQSSNEELQSTNEELETSKEELQATNEELTTLNEELQNRNLELTTANNDLNNVITHVTVPMIMLGSDLRIRRFNADAAKSLNLIAGDIGRPITDLRSALDFPDLELMTGEAIETVSLKQQEVLDRRGRWHSLRVRPYKTSENRIEGAVITLVDITELKSQAVEARTYAETLLETVRECILVLDADLRVTRANSTFYEIFRASPEETEGQPLQELGEGQWNIPHLLDLLAGVLTSDAELRNFDVEREFPALGPRIMVLNARRIRREGQADGKILLAIEDATEQRRSMETVRNQARLIDLAHDAIIVRDPEGVIKSWNQGAETLYGFSRQEALGKVSHILLKTVFPEPLEELQRGLLAQGEWEGEMAQTARSGDRIVVASRQVLQRDDQGRPVATLEINRDITQRRQAEERLRAGEARLRSLVNSMDDAVFEIDAQGTCLNVWTANEHLLIRPRSELIGHRIEAFLPAESARAIMQACERVSRTGGPESIEYALELAEGQHWFVARISPIVSSQGKSATLSLLVRDITPGKKAEILVRESEERFRLLMEGVRDYAIVMLEAEGNVASWNSGAERINGYRADEIMGKHFSIFYPPEAAQSGEPQRALQTAAGKDRVETEGWRVRKDGSRFRANVVLTAVRDHGGNLRGFAEVTRDVTEWKRIEDAMRGLSARVLRLRDEEGRRIARELHDSTSQNLAALAMNLSVIEEHSNLLQDGRASKALASSLELAKKAAEEVRNLSHLLHPPELDAVGLAAAVRWYAIRFSERSGIAVEVDLKDDLGRLSQEVELALFRVVQEGLSNVQRHSGSSVATVRISRLANQVTVEIEDEGRGVSNEALQGGGDGAVMVGIGIAGMRERLRQLAGSLDIASRHPGTSLKATVPLKRDT